jgi:FkbM family methyltransferase
MNLIDSRLLVDPIASEERTVRFDRIRQIPPEAGADAHWEIEGVCFLPGKEVTGLALRDADGALPAAATLGLPSPALHQRCPAQPGSDSARCRVTFAAELAARRPWLRLDATFADGGSEPVAYLRLAEGARAPVEAPYVATVTYAGQRLRFFVADEGDEIQGRHHARGVFYEQGLLEYLREACPKDQTIIDVGANVGNHAVFFEKFALAREVLVFEPNPPTADVLLKNLALNDCRAVNTRYLRHGVGDGTGRWRVGAMPANNWGGTRLVADPEGSATLRLDDLLPDVRVALLKIDVEGMEAAVLRGAARLIVGSAPVIAVEVTPETAPEVLARLGGHGYRVERTFSMYRDIATLVAVPVGCFRVRGESDSGSAIG